MFTPDAVDDMLATYDGDHVSQHDDYPAYTGDNEVSGSPYARVPVTFVTSGAGTKIIQNSALLTLDAPAAFATLWFGVWDALTVGNFRGLVPAGGQAREYQVDPATDVFTLPAHGWLAEQKLVFYGGSAPGGITLGTQIVFVRDVTTDTFKVETSIGAGAINVTSRPTTKDAVVSAIAPSLGGVDRELTIAAGALKFGGNH